MTKKELKRLSRSDLLELLLEQTRRCEALEAELEQARAALNERTLRMQNAGDLAHAVLEVNGVMEAAQAAARQYLDSAAALEADARARSQRMQQLQAETEAACERLRAETRSACEVQRAQAEAEAKRICENLIRNAMIRAQNMTRRPGEG
ncbi:MAG: hypothetical protein IJ484_01875 [Oscillospiraceae bacterium]|nr:hypothetical protein [Oscillospiraceae bacterium]